MKWNYPIRDDVIARSYLDRWRRLLSDLSTPPGEAVPISATALRPRPHSGHLLKRYQMIINKRMSPKWSTSGAISSAPSHCSYRSAITINIELIIIIFQASAGAMLEPKSVSRQLVKNPERILDNSEKFLENPQRIMENPCHFLLDIKSKRSVENWCDGIDPPIKPVRERSLPSPMIELPDYCVIGLWEPVINNERSIMDFQALGDEPTETATTGIGAVSTSGRAPPAAGDPRGIVGLAARWRRLPTPIDSHPYRRWIWQRRLTDRRHSIAHQSCVGDCHRSDLWPAIQHGLTRFCASRKSNAIDWNI